MSKCLIRYSFLLLYWIFISNVCASTWYCDLDAVSNGDGSMGDPWNTLSNMKTGCDSGCNASGDIINIKGSETISGTFYWDISKNVTLQLWSGNSCTITASGSGDGFRIDSGGMLIDSLAFTSSGARTTSDPIIQIEIASTISNCTINNYDGPGIYVGGGSGSVIDSNTITNAIGGYGEHGVWTDAASTIIRYNYIANMNDASNCIFVQEGADNSEIYGNYLEANAEKSDVIVRGSSNSDLSGVRVYNNFFAGANYVSGIDIEGSEGVYNVEDLQVYNNIFTTTKNTSASKADWRLVIRIHQPGASSGTPVRIYNNTICMKGSDTSSELMKAGLGFVTGSYSTGYVEIKNNIIRVEDTDANGYVYCVYEDCSSEDMANVTDDYNYFYNAGSGESGNIISGSDYSTGTYTVTGTDPQLHTPCSILFPQSTAPTINAGTSLSSYFTIGIGMNATWPVPDLVTRPQGSDWDIGAYEYEGLTNIFGTSVSGGTIQ